MDLGAMRPLPLLFLSVQHVKIHWTSFRVILPGNPRDKIEKKKKDLPSSVLGVTKRCRSSWVEAIKQGHGKSGNQLRIASRPIRIYRRDQPHLGSLSTPVILANSNFRSQPTKRVQSHHGKSCLWKSSHVSSCSRESRPSTEYTRTHKTIFPFFFNAGREPYQTLKKKEIGGLIFASLVKLAPSGGFVCVCVCVYVSTTLMT